MALNVSAVCDVWGG